MKISRLKTEDSQRWGSQVSDDMCDWYSFNETCSSLGNADHIETSVCSMEEEDVQNFVYEISNFDNLDGAAASLVGPRQFQGGMGLYGNRITYNAFTHRELTREQVMKGCIESDNMIIFV